MWDAIVLAGGAPEPGLDPSLPNKGFLEVAGLSLVGHVVAALQHARGIGRIAVVGPSALEQVLPDGLVVVPDAGGIMDNVMRAAQALDGAGSILVAAADVPLLTGDVIEEFLAACTRLPADFHYAVVPKEAMDRQFPTAQKTYVTLSDGTFCGGNLMLVNAGVLDRVRPFVERMIAARKKPWLMAQMFGWATVMKMVSHQLSIAELVARATEITGIAVQPVIIPRPELALDVDVGKPENLELIRHALERRRTG
jgi:molybdopterin-guanine dinucleotide biosynthesis protein A